jgi:hypothetical protein
MLRMPGPPETLAEVTGDPDQIALIGMRRPARWANPSSGFTSTYSIFSFVLFNVKATVAKGAFYPPKLVAQDIEMVHVARDHGMVCLKSNRLFHRKIPFKVERALPQDGMQVEPVDLLVYLTGLAVELHAKLVDANPLPNLILPEAEGEIVVVIRVLEADDEMVQVQGAFGCAAKHQAAHVIFLCSQNEKQQSAATELDKFDVDSQVASRIRFIRDEALVLVNPQLSRRITGMDLVWFRRVAGDQ